MSKVIWQVYGFMAAPNGAMDGMFAFIGPNRAAPGRNMINHGDCVKLFDQPRAHPIQPQPQDVSQAGAVANLHFRVHPAA